MILKKNRHIIFITVFLVFSSYYFLKEIYDTKMLDKEGEYVKGRVVKVIDLPRSRNELRYIFFVNGVKYSGERSLSLTAINKDVYCKKGSSVKIVYLPSNPKINRLYIKD